MTIEEVFKNKDLILAQKKNAIKHGDIVLNSLKVIDKSEAVKEEMTIAEQDPTVLNAKLVINTTNIIDSHMDCHIDGLWSKSLKETKLLYLLQEHEMDFDKVIADSVKDELKAYTKTVSFKSLGYNFEGNTEALIFDTKIKKDVNTFMFEKYKQGRVYNHSVGMRYMKIFLCINSEEASYSAEKEAWDKYYPMVANKEIADSKGYFWAVTEAKIIEGSAVIKGSNECTPIMEIEIEKQDIEAVPNTSNAQTESLKSTQEQEKKQFFINLTKS